MTRLLYIHGAFSAFKPDSEKVKNLKKAFDVYGINYRMDTSYPINKASLVQFCIDNRIDAVVGTSLGGLYAAEISAELSIPAILINPCVEPVMSLSTIVGTMKNYTTGKRETLTQDNVNTFPELANISELCQVFVGLKDDLIDARKTIDMFHDKATIIADPNEDHYWETFGQNELIQKHIERFINL